MIVVDTTVWIDFLEARGTDFERHLAELVENDAPIALVDQPCTAKCSRAYATRTRTVGRG